MEINIKKGNILSTEVNDLEYSGIEGWLGSHVGGSERKITSGTNGSVIFYDFT